MKKLLIIAVCIVCKFSSFSQEFGGVHIGGDLNTVINNFKEKGMKFVKYAENNTCAFMKGTMSNIPMDFMILSTPKTKKVFSLVVLFEQRNTFEFLKKEFDSYFGVLYENYGQPDEVNLDFVSPFYLGDGYELTALRAEKCDYSSIWRNHNGANIELRISKFLRVQISYDNVQNVNLYVNEKEALERQTF